MRGKVEAKEETEDEKKTWATWLANNAKQKITEKKEQTQNRLNTIRLSRAQLFQGAGTLFRPFLLAHPHILLVGDLKKRTSVWA
jgi:hypothetical protein